MGILFTILMGFLLTITIGFLFTIVLGIQLTISTKALQERSPQPGLIFHSDRGSQYASHKVKKVLKAWHIHQSMSNKGNCFDNAMMESFFSSLKKELVHLMTFHSKDQARRAIFEYIEIFYNRQRRHSALNQKSPLEYYQDAAQTF